MRQYPHVICVRLSDSDWEHWQNILRRFSPGFCPSKAERFRKLLKALDLPYATVWDQEGSDDDPATAHLKAEEEADDDLPEWAREEEEQTPEIVTDPEAEVNPQFVDLDEAPEES